MKTLYTAEALATGEGRDGHGRTSDGTAGRHTAQPAPGPSRNDRDGRRGAAPLTAGSGAGGGSAPWFHVLVDAEKVRWVVLGLELGESLVIAPKGLADKILVFVPEKIQEEAVA